MLLFASNCFLTFTKAVFCAYVSTDLFTKHLQISIVKQGENLEKDL